MSPIKLIRKLGKILRGGETQRAIFLGIFLGFGIGMIPGFNLTLLIFIFAFLFLNSNGAMGAIAIVIGKLLCISFAPLTYKLGYFMIHSAGLSGLVSYCSETPVLALLDLQIYCLMGALPIIIVVGGLAGYFVGRLLVGLHESLGNLKGKSAKFDKLSQNIIMRGLLRVAFGKKKPEDADKKKSPLIRKGRVILAVVLVAIIFVVQMLFINTAVKAGIEGGLGTANGAEVNLGSADLSLGSGELVMNQLQVTDPARPTHNRVQAERIVLKVSINDLLAKRFVVDLVDCDDMQLDTQREKPGEVYLPEDKKPEPAGPLEQLDFGKMGGQAVEYTKQIKKFNEQLEKLMEYLKKDDPSKDQQDDQERLALEALSKGYLKLSAQEFLAKRPTWILREINVRRLKIAPNFPSFTVEGRNLSSHPSLLPEDEKASLVAKPDPQALADFNKQVEGMLKGGVDSLLNNGKKTEGDQKKSGGLLGGFLKK